MTTNEEYIKRNKVVTVDDDKNTKLHYATALNRVDLVEEAINKGQRLDAENYLGWTPLMMAVRNGNEKITDLLLSNNADATKRNRYGMSVFLISVTCGNLNIVTKILNHLLCGGISRQNLQKTFSPISLAIMFGHSHIFKYLIERSFDVNMITPLTGISPLMFAAAVGDNKAIKKLIQNNADTKMKNYLGKTAHDILQARNQNADIVSSVGKPKQPQLPLIILSPHTPNSPCLQLTPYPVPSSQNMRKSSNTFTPSGFYPAPNITPITPHQFIPQMFFPSDFSPSRYLSPMMTYHSNEFLNATIRGQSAFIFPPNSA